MQERQEYQARTLRFSETQRRPAPAEHTVAFRDHRLLTCAGLPVIAHHTGLISQTRCYKTQHANKESSALV